MKKFLFSTCLVFALVACGSPEDSPLVMEESHPIKQTVEATVESAAQIHPADMELIYPGNIDP